MLDSVGGTLTVVTRLSVHNEAYRMPCPHGNVIDCRACGTFRLMSSGFNSVRSDHNHTRLLVVRDGFYEEKKRNKKKIYSRTTEHVSFIGKIRSRVPDTSVFHISFFHVPEHLIFTKWMSIK